MPQYSSTIGNWNKTTFDTSLKYVLSDNTNVYARIAEGYHGGVVTGQAMFSPLEQAKPETVLSYEAGIKTETSDHRLSSNISVFRYDYKDMQLVAYSNLANGQEINALINAKGGTGTGFEEETTYRALKDLTLTANFGYTDTRISGPTYIADPRNSANELDITGQPFPFAPKWSGTFLADYHHTLSNGSVFFATTDWSYRSKENFQLSSFVQPEFVGQAYWEGGLRTGFRFNDTELAFWVRNITDVTYLTSAVNVSGFAGVFNNPRTFGIELSHRF